MNVRVYFERVRKVEASIPDSFPVLVSAATPDGGVAGRLTETPRSLAAKMIADGSARLASESEAQAFREQQSEAKRAAEQAAAAAKVQFTLLTSADFNELKAAKKPAEE